MKATLATIKSFIRNNQAVLHIKSVTDHNNMVDARDPFRPATPTSTSLRNTLGIAGAWFVKGSRDYFEPYQDDDFQGFMVFNCCGSFILAIPIT
ncbi:hypothetical protein LCGC14_0821310 [marine sediment metagenome]|uniref:Uncharacterized protein n=1 Tax=marine sediment metagenome TaxID=412755 RepID=A0A0F9SR87_9ZZZZ